MDRGTVIIELRNNNEVLVKSDVHGQGLYEAYVALTLRVISELKDDKDIKSVSSQAVEDALNILKGIKTGELCS